MRKFIFYIILLVLAGCQAETEQADELTPLVRTKANSLQYAQSESINLEELGIINPTKIRKKDSLFIILTPTSKYRFAIYNHNSKEIQRLVPAGDGEGEGLYYLGLTLHKDIASAFDFGTGNLVEFNLNEGLFPRVLPIFTTVSGGGKTTLGAIRVNNQLISTGIYTEGRYCCTNPALNTDSYSVSYPDCLDLSLSDTLKSIRYASNYLAAHPDGTRFACANVENGCLDICTIKGNQLTRVNEVNLSRPKINLHKRGRGKGMWHPVSYSSNNLFGFCDMTVSKDYIFTLYSGKTYRQHKNNVDQGKIILIFDWNSSHVRTYHLPLNCSSISYDEEQQTIYALSKERDKAEIITLNL